MSQYITNGQQAKQYRLQLGLSLRVLGNLAGVHHMTVKKWEEGANIRIESAKKIANALGARLKAQYGDNGEGVSYVTTLPSGKSVKITITELE